MNTYIKKEDHYEIILNGKYGGIALIDKEDYKQIKHLSWASKKDGYVWATKGHINIYLHRLILQPKNNEVIDHINQNKLDNRKSNLRIVTPSQSNMNRKANCINKLGVRGVYFEKSRPYKKGNKIYYTRPRWLALITIDYKQIYLGVFKNKEDAIKARQEAEALYFKEYNYKEALT